MARGGRRGRLRLGSRTVDPALLVRWRLANQLVSTAGSAGGPTTAAGVVGRLGAAQGQDLLPASWSVAQRGDGLTAPQVAAELDAGAVLRTHLLRPTWHLVVPADIRWLLRATGPRVQRSAATGYRQWGPDDETRAAARRIVATVLADGRHRTRAELGEALAHAGLPLTGIALGNALIDAELEGVVCSGVARGAQQTYALLDERAPALDGRSREESLAELARRYVVTRGPVTEHDLAGWASLTLAEARRATAAIADELARFEDDGLTWWHAPGEPPVRPRGHRVDLVQAYDELVMSYSRTRDVVTAGVPLFDDAPHPLMHWVLVDGRAAGRWAYRRDARGRPARVVTRPLRAWSAAERAGVGRAVACFGRFLGVDLTWTETSA